MFYCKRCATANDWPVSRTISYGQCEGCGRTDECSDIPAYRLKVPTVPGGDLDAIMARVVRYGDMRRDAERAFGQGKSHLSQRLSVEASYTLTDISAMIERMVDNG